MVRPTGLQKGSDGRLKLEKRREELLDLGKAAVQMLKQIGTPLAACLISTIMLFSVLGTA